MSNKTFLNQIKKAVIDWAQFKPKDEYIKETITKQQLDSGWTCQKSCLVMVAGNPTDSGVAKLTIRDSKNEVVVCLANGGGNYYLRGWFLATKGETYKTDYSNGLTANLSRLNLVCTTPSALGGGKL